MFTSMLDEDDEDLRMFTNDVGGSHFGNQALD